MAQKVEFLISSFSYLQSPPPELLASALAPGFGTDAGGERMWGQGSALILKASAWGGDAGAVGGSEPSARPARCITWTAWGTRTEQWGRPALYLLNQAPEGVRAGCSTQCCLGQ